MKNNKIDKKAIIERGYCLDEEYEQIFNSSDMRRFSTGDESFWGYPLNSKLFVFCNYPLEFMGSPRSIIGMVGKFSEVNRVDIEGSIALFKKTGQAAVDYYNREIEND